MGRGGRGPSSSTGVLGGGDCWADGRRGGGGGAGLPRDRGAGGGGPPFEALLSTWGAEGDAALVLRGGGGGGVAAVGDGLAPGAGRGGDSVPVVPVGWLLLLAGLPKTGGGGNEEGSASLRAGLGGGALEF